MGPSWFAEVKLHGVRRVAAAFGLTVHERPGHGIGPCPACSAPTRHPKHKDKRGALGLTADGQGWHCHECAATGDAVTIAAYVVGGSARPSDWAEVRRACASHGLCDPDPNDTAAPAPRRARVPPPPPKAPEQPRRPPASEVRELWGGCTTAGDDAEVSAWLRSRGLNPSDVDDRDLVRALPPTASLPKWAWGPDGAWTQSGHRCIVPLFNEHGVLTSVRARAIREVQGRKSIAPARFETRGLVFADDLARRLLERSRLGDGRLSSEAMRRASVVISEGEPAFLAAATCSSDADEDAPAVFGIEAGAWTPEIASRIPDGTRVILDVDDDAAGDKYANAVADTLINRCDVRDARKAAT
jgi:hypothetical protein